VLVIATFLTQSVCDPHLGMRRTFPSEVNMNTPIYRYLVLPLVAVALLVAAVGVSAADEGTSDDQGRGRGPTCQNGTGSIAGVVKDSTGTAVISATVRASSRAGSASAKTAADGSYSLTGLCNGSYSVGADKRGVGSGIYDTDGDGHHTPVVIADASPAATGINIALGQHGQGNLCQGGTGSIAGSVKDSAGAAVEGATVKASSWAGRATATTAADGSYSLTGLCHGNYHVSADKQGVGAGVYDADGDGHHTPVILNGTASSATGVDIALAARGGGRRP